MSDAIRIRAPHPEEYGACRMLLPAESAPGIGAQYLLAIQDQAPFIAGAASYIPGSRFIHSIHVRVIRTCRRRGIGSRLLARILEVAQEKGSEALTAMIDSGNGPEAEAFLRRHGFTMGSRVTTVSGAVTAGMEVITPLAARIRKSSLAPENRQIVHLPEAPRNAVVTLYLAELARNPLTTPWSLLDEISSPRFARSPAMLANGRLAGFLLWSLDGSVATIPARIVAPEFQGGPTNVLLMDDALRTGWDAGAREIEFDIPQDNTDTEKLARRFAAKTVRTADRYFRRCDQTGTL